MYNPLQPRLVLTDDASAGLTRYHDNLKKAEDRTKALTKISQQLNTSLKDSSLRVAKLNKGFGLSAKLAQVAKVAVLAYIGALAKVPSILIPLLSIPFERDAKQPDKATIPETQTARATEPPPPLETHYWSPPEQFSNQFVPESSANAKDSNSPDNYASDQSPENSGANISSMVVESNAAQYELLNEQLYNYLEANIETTDEIFRVWDNMFRNVGDIAANYIETAITNMSLGMKSISGMTTAISRELRREAIRSLANIAIEEAKNFAKKRVLKLMEAADAAKSIALNKSLNAVRVRSDLAQNQAKTYGGVFAQVASTPAFMTAPIVAAKYTGAMTAAVAPMISGSFHGGIDMIPAEYNNKSFLLKAGERVLQPTANRDITAAAAKINSGAQSEQPQEIHLHHEFQKIEVRIGELDFRDTVVRIVKEETRDGNLLIHSRAVSDW